MADGTKGKKRKSRPIKATVAVAATKQRTLRDMFGGASKALNQELSISQGPPDAVIELSDSEPELTTLPSSPAERTSISETSSLAALEGKDGLSAMVLESKPPLPTPPPRKLFAIFEKKPQNAQDRTEQTEIIMPMSTTTEESSENSGLSSSTRQTRSPCISIVVDAPARGLRIGSSREAPIVIEHTSPAPESPKPPTRPAKLVYSIFNRPARATNSGPSKLPVLPAPAPNKKTQPKADWATFPSVAPRFRSRDKGKAREADPTAEVEFDILSRLLSTSQTNDPSPQTLTIPTQCIAAIHDYITTIPQSHQTIPAISRLLDYVNKSPTESPREHPCLNEQWAHRWRPRQANHVLGNEQHALYLRDWLLALRLQGESMRPVAPAQGKKTAQSKKRKAGKTKKPDIVRHVKRRRRDGLEDDFLAPDVSTDEEDIPDVHSSDWDDFEFCREMDARLTGASPSTDASRASSPLTPLEDDKFGISYKPTRFGRQISNTILLAGPSGSGKTAAVYACAEELGWEVFEVYPGIGERSGTELNKLVGDVGKNHTVKVHQSPKKSSAKASFFQKQAEPAPKRKANARRVVESEDELDLLREGGENFLADVVKEATPEPTVNQSVILIEEADVLYQTDTYFWPALVNIIKHCRRPVVLTCSDVSLIPRGDLPLQATLDFEHCPTSATASYLQALSLAEQRPVAREHVVHMLQDPNDLRHTIQQLQLCIGPSLPQAAAVELDDVDEDVPGSRPGSSPLIHPIDTSSLGPSSISHEDDVYEQGRLLQLAYRQCETLSYTDACLSRGSMPALNNYFADEPLPNTDDELGYIVLYSDVDTDRIPVSPCYLQDLALPPAITTMLERHEDAIPLPNSEALQPDLRGYAAQVGSIMYGSDLARWPFSEAALYLDYAPWVRCMAEVDEAQRAALSQAESSQRRRTRNSQRSEQQSWLSLDSETCRALLSTGLRE
ncbi:hypothetical protein PHLGIDRAFT_115366 [Phlebiopsis gigantea 11061_1 CR5-6]|uniref:AAA+ ATPase domain-containing protein n=1 Tax=Phlebiopsis gigantea (strain 11061_1 CR5-6) TaxID=745531 RepID=A0A0C3NYT8_PHLG1|nr:hypothetical protein PHLGIDRAFT_115366 [Phlebiopsis gigantea 11061_1 CR5-6]